MYPSQSGPDIVFRDLVTLRNLTDDRSGTEVLGLTQPGHLSMYAIDDLGSRTPLWTGNAWQICTTTFRAREQIGFGGWNKLL